MTDGKRVSKTDVPKKRISNLKDMMGKHILAVLGNDPKRPKKDILYNGFAYSVREILIQKWLDSQRSYYKKRLKRVYYLSMEFLPGRFLKNYIINLNIEKNCKEAIADTGFTLEELETEEVDPGLGNGGLGRLASCFLDSLSCLGVPSYGYGIRYDYGIFYQKIVNGWQVEFCDNWLKKGNPWEISRRGFLYTVKLYGRSESYSDESGNIRYRWVDYDTVDTMACDFLIPGYRSKIVNNMRLWTTVSSHEFNMEFYNHGEYMKAMENKMLKENITKVLYPSDEAELNKMLRLKQEYVFVAATFQDIMRRFKKSGLPLKKLPDYISVQLNDTHPAIGIAELMRLLLDEEFLSWEETWEICTKTFSYTNHTVLPEALEVWHVEMIGKLLPRHLEIIYEINRRFLDDVRKRYPGDVDKIRRMSVIGEEPYKHVRMAHLAIIGSHRVNGVAKLHTNILKNSIFRDFYELEPEKFLNITNGISQRRWLLQANPLLSGLITSIIGDKWVKDLTELKKLERFVENKEFLSSWMKVKLENKKRLKEYIIRKTGVEVDENSIFDVQIKRIHEYKRQLLNVLHVITLYHRLKNNNSNGFTPRTVIFAGKAAPGYYFAKLIIKLISDVAEKINADRDVNNLLKVVFLPNYCITQAEKVIPAADLSEQISTAGYEASGTSNMKLALNGALTIGTLDGANIEIFDEVGRENVFIFGHTDEELKQLRKNGYNPEKYYTSDSELKEALDLIADGYFSSGNKTIFKPVFDALVSQGDRYFVLADYRDYVNKQQKVSDLYNNQELWAKKSVLNVANMGRFSSDRAIREYAEKIWKIKV